MLQEEMKTCKPQNLASSSVPCCIFLILPLYPRHEPTVKRARANVNASFWRLLFICVFTELCSNHSRIYLFYKRTELSLCHFMFFFFMNLSFDHRLQNHFSRYLCAFSLHSRQTCAFRRLCCSYSFNSQWILPVFVWTADIYF